MVRSLADSIVGLSLVFWLRSETGLPLQEGDNTIHDQLIVSLSFSPVRLRIAPVSPVVAGETTATLIAASLPNHPELPLSELVLRGTLANLFLLGLMRFVSK